jgi:hypothetical protein
VILGAALSAARWAGRLGGQERRRLLLHDSPLDLAEELLPLGQGQAELLQPLMLLGQDQQILSALGAILGDAHELDLELDGHRCAPQGQDRATIPGLTHSPEVPAPTLKRSLSLQVRQRFLHFGAISLTVTRRATLTQVSAAGLTPDPGSVLASGDVKMGRS